MPHNSCRSVKYNADVLIMYDARLNPGTEFFRHRYLYKWVDIASSKRNGVFAGCSMSYGAIYWDIATFFHDPLSRSTVDVFRNYILEIWIVCCRKELPTYILVLLYISGSRDIYVIMIIMKFCSGIVQTLGKDKGFFIYEIHPLKLKLIWANTVFPR